MQHILLSLLPAEETFGIQALVLTEANYKSNIVSLKLALKIQFKHFEV